MSHKMEEFSNITLHERTNLYKIVGNSNPNEFAAGSWYRVCHSRRGGCEKQYREETPLHCFLFGRGATASIVHIIGVDGFQDEDIIIIIIII
jgi:hypothetical protein